MTTETLETMRGSLATTKHVDELIRNYKKHRWVDNSKKIGKADALSTWYGLEELQSFLTLAKENNADGVKIFYGVYPADYKKEAEFAERQTVVLVATRSSKEINGTRNKSIYINQNGKKEILAMNYGGICPPFCSGFPPDNQDLGIELDPLGLTFNETEKGIDII